MPQSARKGKPRRMVRRGPFVLAAFLCESVIEGKDGLISAVKIMDRIGIDPREFPTEMGERPAVGVSGLIILREVPKGNPVTVQLMGFSPSGEPVLEASYVGEPGGEHSGMNVLLKRFPLDVAEHGVYWFDVEYEGRFLTRFSVFVDREGREKEKVK